MLWIIVLVLVAYLLYTRVWKVHKFWKHRNVISTNPWIFLGDMAPTVLKTKSMAENIIDIYNKFPGERYFGAHQFFVPSLFIKDLDLVKQIAIKDFDYFIDHRNFVDPEVDPLFGTNLFCMKGQRWRNMRATLSPAFTSAKMKQMFFMMSECADQFVQHFVKQNKGKETISLEMKDAFTRLTNDVIASTAFGIKCDSMGERENEFYVMGKEATTFTGIRAMTFFLYGICPSILKFFKMAVIPDNVSNFFRKIMRDTIDTREKHGIIRPDMINLLMEARKGKLKHEPQLKEDKDDQDAGYATAKESSIGRQEVKFDEELSLDDLTAQAIKFFFGGFDTTSTAMCFMSHELATNPDVQQKLQQEVDETWQKCNGKLTYDILMKMKYMDMVLSETFRKWPPGFVLDRISVKDYTIEPTRPEEKPLTIPAGTVIMIPSYGFHMDPQFFPDPHKFNPERFSDENKDSITPGSYMPFGVGPRNCIGSRFALLENKILFFYILAKFDIVPVEKTQVPLKLSKGEFTMLSENGFWLGLKPRNV